MLEAFGTSNLWKRKNLVFMRSQIRKVISSWVRATLTRIDQLLDWAYPTEVHSLTKSTTWDVSDLQAKPEFQAMNYVEPVGNVKFCVYFTKSLSKIVPQLFPLTPQKQNHANLKPTNRFVLRMNNHLTPPNLPRGTSRGKVSRCNPSIHLHRKWPTGSAYTSSHNLTATSSYK